MKYDLGDFVVIADPAHPCFGGMGRVIGCVCRDVSDGYGGLMEQITYQVQLDDRNAIAREEQLSDRMESVLDAPHDIRLSFVADRILRQRDIQRGPYDYETVRGADPVTCEMDGSE